MFDKFIAEAEERATQHNRKSTVQQPETFFSLFDQEATRISERHSKTNNSDSSSESELSEETSDTHHIIGQIDAFYQ
jgi:hypothetical protein